MKKSSKQIITLLIDLAILPFLIGCKHLSELLLTNTHSTCRWTLLGGKCITCGGTHFVRDLLSGNVVAAFHDNELLFCLTVYLAFSWLLYNLYILFHLQFAKLILSKLYNIKTLIIFCVVLVAYLLIRNIPVGIKLAEYLASR